METRRTQQLDVNLTNVQDDAVRAALSSIVTFVNQSTQNLETGGSVKGRDVGNLKGTAGFDDLGRMFCENLDTGKGQIKFATFEGSLSGSLSMAVHKVVGQVYGAIGYAEFEGGPYWNVMCLTAAASGTIAFFDPSLGISPSANYEPDHASVSLINSFAGTNNYRIVVFYKELKRNRTNIE